HENVRMWETLADSITGEGMNQYSAAMEQIDTIIHELKEILRASSDVKSGIETRNAGLIREGMITLRNHTDGYWGRLVIGNGTAEIFNILNQLENPQSEEEMAEERAELNAWRAGYAERNRI